jgi:SprT protein
MTNEFKEALSDFLPKGSHDLFYSIIEKEKFNLRITRPRSTKFADFRPGKPGSLPSISINNNLHPYAFLITFLHEYAHLTVWKKFNQSVKPHGPEWRKEFSLLLNNFIGAGVFPDDVEVVLKNHLFKPKASSIRDVELTKILNKYNPDFSSVYLSDLPDNSFFKLENNGSANGMVFKKINKVRTRYKCLCIQNNRMYFVSGIAKVIQEESIH